MIKTLTSWRGIMALVVVLFHYRVPVFNYFVPFAVCFFYVLSGFLLARRYEQQPVPRWRQFFTVRAVRLYVASWIVLLPLAAIMLIYHNWGGTPQFLTQLALVHSYVPSKDYFFSFNTVSWFLCGLLLAYACFPLLMRLMRRISLQVKLVAVAVWMVLLFIVMPHASEQVRVCLYVNPVMRLGDFVIGMVLAHLVQHVQERWRQPSFMQATILELLAIAVLAVAAWLVAVVPQIECYSDIVWCYLPVSLLILVCALLNGNEGVPGRLLTCRPLLWLGGVSMEIYLLQMVAARLYNYFVAPVLGHFGVETAYDLYPIFGLLLLLPLAWLMHRYLMQPLRHRAEALKK